MRWRQGAQPQPLQHAGSQHNHDTGGGRCKQRTETLTTTGSRASPFAAAQMAPRPSVAPGSRPSADLDHRDPAAEFGSWSFSATCPSPGGV